MELCQLLEAEEKAIWPNQQTRFENDGRGRMFSVKPTRSISKTGQDQDGDKLWWVDTLNTAIKEDKTIHLRVEHKCFSLKHSITSRKIAQTSPS